MLQIHHTRPSLYCNLKFNLKVYDLNFSLYCNLKFNLKVYDLNFERMVRDWEGSPWHLRNLTTLKLNSKGDGIQHPPPFQEYNLLGIHLIISHINNQGIPKQEPL